jgi:hypothetical protein
MSLFPLQPPPNRYTTCCPAHTGQKVPTLLEVGHVHSQPYKINEGDVVVLLGEVSDASEGFHGQNHRTQPAEMWGNIPIRDDGPDLGEWKGVQVGWESQPKGSVGIVGSTEGLAP